MRNTTKNVLKNLLLCAAMFCLMMVMAMPAHAATSNGAELLSLINNERAANGIAPLTIGSTELNAAAQARAEELATNCRSTVWTMFLWARTTGQLPIPLKMSSQLGTVTISSVPA